MSACRPRLHLLRVLAEIFGSASRNREGNRFEVVMMAALLVPMVFVWGAGVEDLWVVRLQRFVGKRWRRVKGAPHRGLCSFVREGTSWEAWLSASLRAPS